MNCELLPITSVVASSTSTAVNIRPHPYQVIMRDVQHTHHNGDRCLCCGDGEVMGWKVKWCEGQVIVQRGMIQLIFHRSSPGDVPHAATASSAAQYCSQVPHFAINWWRAYFNVVLKYLSIPAMKSFCVIHKLCPDDSNGRPSCQISDHCKLHCVHASISHTRNSEGSL